MSQNVRARMFSGFRVLNDVTRPVPAFFAAREEAQQSLPY